MKIRICLDNLKFVKFASQSASLFAPPPAPSPLHLPTHSLSVSLTLSWYIARIFFCCAFLSFIQFTRAF